MKRAAVTSRSLRSLGYDPEQQVLEVEFSSGALYRYEEVPPEAVQALLAAGFWTGTGLLGTLMALLWLATEHTAGWTNHNLLLCSPLALGLLPAARRWWQGRQPASGFFWLALLLLAGSLFALLLYGLQVRGQAHLGWIVLLTPAHAVLAWQLRRRPGQAGAR